MAKLLVIEHLESRGDPWLRGRKKSSRSTIEEGEQAQIERKGRNKGEKMKGKGKEDFYVYTSS